MIPIYDDNPALGKPLLVISIITICIIIWFWQSGLGYQGNNEAIRNFGLTPAVFLGNVDQVGPLFPIFTLLTSMFMHGGFMHLIGNMLYMWIFADNIEDALGQKKFIIFYLLSGVGAAMAQVLMDTSSQVPMVGASGAIGGVLGAYLINHPNAKVLVLIPFGFFSQLIKIRALYVLGFWFILQFINSSMMSSQGGGVAYAAHIGGFISGMILILFFNKKAKRKTKIMKNPWT